MKTRYFILTAAVFLFSQAIYAQTTFRMDPKNSQITIEGTSSVHDWEMQVTEMHGVMKLKIEGAKIGETRTGEAKIGATRTEDSQKVNTQIGDITAVNLTIPSKALNSKNSLMDKKTYSALKSEKYETISFTLKQVNNLSSNGTSIAGSAVGTLSVAGQSKQVILPFRGELENNQTIRFKGEEKINMKDFNISPPTALMGTMKTGEEVTVHFDVLFRPETVYSEMVLPGKN